MIRRFSYLLSLFLVGIALIFAAPEAYSQNKATKRVDKIKEQKQQKQQQQQQHQQTTTPSNNKGTPKTQTPNKETQKKEEPKKEPVKKEPSKSDTSKTQSQKKETPKKETPKKETPAVQPSKKGTSKKEVVKKVASKVPAPKKETSKKETPKVEVTVSEKVDSLPKAIKPRVKPENPNKPKVSTSLKVMQQATEPENVEMPKVENSENKQIANPGYTIIGISNNVVEENAEGEFEEEELEDVEPEAFGSDDEDEEFDVDYSAAKSEIEEAKENLKNLFDNETTGNLSYDYYLKEITDGRHLYKMVDMPISVFTMGATKEQGEDAYYDESPTHHVSLYSYSMGATEVPQWLWEAVMGKNPSLNVGETLPVDNVSWEDCQLFIGKLNSMLGENFRLPTEAEWEYAARGAQSGGTKYAGDKKIKNVAWYSGNSKNKTHEVGTLAPTAQGLYDMCGNVQEWCQDWYDGNYYKHSPETNPKGPASGTLRVIRGGGISDPPRDCRVSYRLKRIPEYRSANLGLRLAK